MSSKQATTRYYGGLMVAVAVLVGSSLVIAWLDDNAGLPKEMLAALAVVPIAALLSMFWVHWRYLRQLDEYLRQLHVKAVLVATAITLGTGTGWGYLESAADAPALPVFWLNPLFWVVYAIVYVFFSGKDRVPREE
jgi:hypothetical protein